MTSTTRLGIIAGGGTAPVRVIEACRNQGRDFFVLCLEGQADLDLSPDTPHIWLKLGSFGQLRDVIKVEKIDEIVMIGHVRRPSLSELKPDWLGLKILTKIGLNLLGDDAVLRAIGQAIEQECGARVIGVQDILGGVLMHIGCLGSLTPDAQAEQDITRGMIVARTLGTVDVGQSVIIQQGIILGVEASEGTDALITRCKDLLRAGPGGILIKLAKPQQDNRFDLPTIGPETIETAFKAGLRGIAVEAERSLLIDRDKTRTLANEKRIFVVGINPPPSHKPAQID